MKSRISILLLAALTVCASADSKQPADPKANPKARAILRYFQELSSKPKPEILSGQFANFGKGTSLQLMNDIKEKTGQWPAIFGTDYAEFRQHHIEFEAPNKAAIEYARQGGIIHISAHMYNPANTNGGGLRDKGVDLADLLKPDTETHRRWMKQLDEMAAGLEELQKAGVVVLWRPFHEMNGGWFWWGAKDTPGFIKVWRHMFDYYTQTKGLHNLLWVYGPNHGPKVADYYAGDQYVDIVGLDAYTDFIDPEHIKGYNEIIALGKPFGFTEYGPHGSSNPPGDYDYRRFIEGIEKNFPKTCFFMCWNAKWSLARNNNTKELLEHPRIINREELPQFGGRSDTTP